MTENVWIELIGFDKNLPDYGVKNYIDNCGFVPSIVSLLLTSLDIVLFHTGYEPEKVLPKECCSYNGREASVERDRQEWTQKDLKGLIDVLHSYGVKVMHASFTGLYGYGKEDFDRKEWLTLHPELMEVTREGEIYPMYGPLKRLGDGTYFEDIFFEKLAEYLGDFGFDGWHACDGWGPERMPVYYIEYSDDFVGQFCDYMKGKTDLKDVNSAMQKDEKGIVSFTEADKAKIKERADYIWENYHSEWTEFVSWRWCEFHKKAVSILKPLGKFIYVNSAWTRDPIEAYHRYGLDYKKLFETGIEGFIVECVASASDLLFGGRSRHFTFTSALMFMKTIMPQAK
ncbi:MAG: hypothetical protein KBT47_03090, partial [Armatimonadetes bacterium]|nr:hypothetical protein [Candidatus Hippobium faecium]